MNNGRHNANSRGDHGFTLVELLVVIAVIAILAALLLPALAKAKASAQSAACKSNLRQLGIALTMYVGEHQKYPGPIMYEDGSTFEANFLSSSWSYPLNAYLPGQASPNPAEGDDRAYSHQSVFTCPAVPKQWQSSLIGSSNGGWAYVSGYGYNVKGTGWVPGNVQDLGLGPRRVGVHGQYGDPGTILWTSEFQVRVPSEMIAIGDSYAKGWHNFPLLVPEEPWAPGDWYFGTIHWDGANTVFCDGHVEYGKTKDWLKPSVPARKRWNNDNQPHSETWRTSLVP